MPENTYLVKESSLTQVADKIREKSYTENNLSFPDGFINGIDNASGFPKFIANNLRNLSFVPQGNIDPSRYTLPEELEIISIPTYDVTSNNESLTLSMGNGWADNGVRKITITTPANRLININNAFGNQTRLREIVFTNGCRTTNDVNNSFGQCTNLVTIQGEIDCSESWVNMPFSGCSKLQNVQFAYNCIGKHAANNLNINDCSNLTNESLISIINGLYENAGKTISLHSIPKATCTTLIGTVSIDNENVYHIFTADENGDTTLAEFITNIKGWTLA